MTDPRKARLGMIALATAAIVATSAAFADDVDSPLVNNASALIAIQLSSEIGEGLSGQLVEKGMSQNEADALVFRVVDGAARCTVRRLQRSEMPQVASFLSLLASNEEMASVTGALDEMYSQYELDTMQSEVALTVRRCLDESMRFPQQAPDQGTVGA